MSYEAKVYRVLIATPSDVEEEREIISKIIQSWNDLNSQSKKIVLLPVKWETHTAPDYGERPQEIINKMIVDDSDLLIGCFWTRIGSPTGKEQSGTLEEIKRISDLKKPVMLYFSKRGQDPSLIDLEQLKKLNDFKAEIKSNALIEEYSNIIDFRDKISRQIEIKIRDIQKNSSGKKIIAKLCAVSIEDGSPLHEPLNLSVNLFHFDKKKAITTIDSNNKYKENKSEIIKEISSIIEKNSTLPLIIGIENCSDAIINNFLVEVRIKANDDDFKLTSENKHLRNPYSYMIRRVEVADDLIKKIAQLDNEGVVKNDGEYYHFSFSDQVIQKGKVKLIRPYLFIRPMHNCKVSVEITLYAENLLTPERKSLEFNISTTVVEKEISDIIPDIDKFIDDSNDVPF